MDIDTVDMIAMQLGLGKVETQMDNVQATLENLDSRFDKFDKRIAELPTLPAIENLDNKKINEHEDRKHKAIDLRTIITSIVVIGTAIGTIYLQLKGV